jgi:hypothetical protein
MKSSHIKIAAVLALILCLAFAGPAIARGPGGGGGGGGGETTAVNNLSFPAIAVDNFAVTLLAAPSFTVPYTGLYPGMTAEEIVWLTANGPWYAQKVTENKWQAEFSNETAVDVTYIDWSDNMESVSPKLRSPFRLEMVLFKALDTPMKAYTMAVLEYPSSSNELQGTNTSTYASSYATVVSAQPKLVVQFLGTSVPVVPTNLTWDDTKWVEAATPVSVSFAPELNVGGKYVFGASSGGWKPTQTGYYRITFYAPAGSGVNLANGTIANAATGFTPPTEGVATAYIVPDKNLTYIDVLVKTSGGGGRR